LLTGVKPCSLKNSRMECNDLGLVTRARTGDTDAFRVLVERHSRALLRLAYRMTGNQQDAEDVVQDSFLRAYKQLARFDERASFGT
jgi:RNA polymerase sigma-70 factor (ECF subfamily)